ncbi:major royal jelly protein 3-like isoform X2 [Mya arenaria]|nr:major royal jelly protein 3-like isoform X2 [Mya arenaria]
MPGVPSTLNVVVKNESDFPILRPFPSWEMQELENCEALQRVQSMEIDPHMGHMWIIDTGYRANMSDIAINPLGKCPPKLIIYDLNKRQEVHRYIFPPTVAGTGLFYLNDIVLGFADGKARYAFISDTLAYKLVVYDYVENTSYAYSHPTMVADRQYMNITIGNDTITAITGINGIAMSPDFKYVYYSSVAGVGLHQIKTSVIVNAKGDNAAFAANVRTLGEKVAPGDGLAYGSNHNLYYSALGPNAIFKWEVGKDAGSERDFDNVKLTSHSELVSDSRMQWVDTMSIDEQGYLWYTTSRLNKLFSEAGVQHTEPNFFIWKIYVGERNYMYDRHGATQGAAGTVMSLTSMLICVCMAYFL